MFLGAGYLYMLIAWFYSCRHPWRTKRDFSSDLKLLKIYNSTNSGTDNFGSSCSLIIWPLVCLISGFAVLSKMCYLVFMQVSVLTDQVEAQGEKIRDLDLCLDEHREKLNATEEMLQQVCVCLCVCLTLWGREGYSQTKAPQYWKLQMDIWCRCVWVVLTLNWKSWVHALLSSKHLLCALLC